MWNGWNGCVYYLIRYVTESKSQTSMSKNDFSNSKLTSHLSPHLQTPHNTITLSAPPLDTLLRAWTRAVFVGRTSFCRSEYRHLGKLQWMEMAMDNIGLSLDWRWIALDHIICHNTGNKLWSNGNKLWWEEYILISYDMTYNYHWHLPFSRTKHSYY
jgi:hypothetical protein